MGQNNKSRKEEIELEKYLNQENAVVMYEMNCEIGEPAFVMDRAVVELPLAV